MIKDYFSVLLLILMSYSAEGQLNQFHSGQVISNYGKIAQVEGMEPLPLGVQFKVSFDVVEQAKAGEINRSFDSVARFINMHAASGVDVNKMKLAVVVHGGAVKDLTVDKFYSASSKEGNKNAALIEALSNNKVNFYVCGQSAAYHGVKKADLLPDVKLSLSAMTAHALLQQQGYTINPF